MRSIPADPEMGTRYFENALYQNLACLKVRSTVETEKPFGLDFILSFNSKYLHLLWLCSMLRHLSGAMESCKDFQLVWVVSLAGWPSGSSP